eukprot:Filipodium_phascolosomae@DN379_c0_g1_i1.p1
MSGSEASIGSYHHDHKWQKRNGDSSNRFYANNNRKGGYNEANDTSGSGTPLGSYTDDSVYGGGTPKGSPFVSRFNQDASPFQQFMRTARATFNKLTLEKFETLYAKLMELPIRDSDNLSGLIGLLFEKATTQHHFIDMYSEICQRLNNQDINNFRMLLMDRCQEVFEDIKNDPQALSPDLSMEERTKYKTKMLGNIKFIANLIRRKIIPKKIIRTCIDELIQVDKDESLETCCVFLMAIGPSHSNAAALRETISTSVKTLSKKCEDTQENRKYSLRIKCLIKDLVDSFRSGWKEQPSIIAKHEAPMKLSELHQKSFLEGRTDYQKPSFQRNQTTPIGYDSHGYMAGPNRSGTQMPMPKGGNLTTRSSGGPITDDGWSVAGPKTSNKASVPPRFQPYQNPSPLVPNKTSRPLNNQYRTQTTLGGESSGRASDGRRSGDSMRAADSGRSSEAGRFGDNRRAVESGRAHDTVRASDSSRFGDNSRNSDSGRFNGEKGGTSSYNSASRRPVVRGMGSGSEKKSDPKSTETSPAQGSKGASTSPALSPSNRSNVSPVSTSSPPILTEDLKKILRGFTEAEFQEASQNLEMYSAFKSDIEGKECVAQFLTIATDLKADERNRSFAFWVKVYQRQLLTDSAVQDGIVEFVSLSKRNHTMMDFPNLPTMLSEFVEKNRKAGCSLSNIVEKQIQSLEESPHDISDEASDT